MLSDKELVQIRDLLEKVLEARLAQFAEIQLVVISDMLMSMTDKYVESLMQLARLFGGSPEEARKEAERMAAMMMQELKK